jgi:hypothetical protein
VERIGAVAVLTPAATTDEAVFVPVIAAGTEPVDTAADGGMTLIFILLAPEVVLAATAAFAVLA